MQASRSVTSIAFLVMLFLSLTACQAQLAVVNDPGSRFYKIRAGSKLVLHRELHIPPERARVYFQHGRRVNGLDNYAVGCWLQVRELGPGLVRPGTFVVRRAESSREWISEPNILRFYRVIYLHSDTPPGVLKLECQVWADPWFPAEISVPQMRAALGEYFTLELAPPGYR
ncbi:MAG: hypothetical protein PVF08_07980 [Gammaproteobacteria bacterium]|jgi:hypothetical protein